MTVAYLVPFLNPLTPLQMMARGAEVVAKGAVDTAARGVATATAPAAAAGAALGQGATDTAKFLGKGLDEVDKLSKRVLLGEAIFVGGAVVLGIAAAWYFSRKNPGAITSGAKTAGKAAALLAAKRAL